MTMQNGIDIEPRSEEGWDGPKLDTERKKRSTSRDVLRYILRQFVQRIAWLVPTLLLVSFGVFFLLDQAPGDVAANIAGEHATTDVIEATRARLGLDQPLWTRYSTWLGNAVQGDFGQSYLTGEDVSSKMVQALPVSLSLLAVAFSFAITLGLILGVGPLLIRRAWLDRAATLLVSLTASAQPVLVGIPLVAFVSIRFRLLPALGYTSLLDDPIAWLKHLILPGIALALIPAGELARQLRSGLQQTLQAPFVVALHARGIPRWKVVLKHALRNAAIPSVTVLGVSIAQMLGATVLVEYLFLMDGLGRLAVRGTLVQDAPIVLGVAIVTALLVSVINLVVDASYAFFNPKALA